MTSQSSPSPVSVASAAPLQALPYGTLGMDAESLKNGILGHLQYTLAELPKHVDSEWEPYVALALAVRDRMIQRWIRTQDTYYEQDAKRVYYLSLEYLMGRTLGNSLVNMGLLDECAKALHELGYRLEDLRDAEWDAGLGNGGLGRLAACFLDSMATLGYPSYGYGLRYDYGIFHQRIVNGAQVEVPDGWLRYGNPWEIPRAGRPLPRAVLRPCRQLREPPRTPHQRLGGHQGRPGHSLRHADPRLRRSDGQHPAPVGRPGRPRVRSRGVQRGRLHRRRRGASALGEHLPRPLPERQRVGGQGAAAGPGVLLRLRHLAGHHSPLPEALPDVRRAAGPSHLRPVRREGGHPAQRHPSRPGHSGADAHPGGRRGARLGRGVGDHDRHLRLHEPHRHGRGPGAVAGEPARDHAAPASADHLRDQSPLPGRRAPALRPATTRARGACPSSRRTASDAYAWPPWPWWAATP